jgi:predicted DsbA family dithiol-disulfide isomerase
VGDYCLQDAAQTLLLGLRFLEVAGELSTDDAHRAVAAVRARFAQEPALEPILDGGKAYFAER